MLGQVLLYFRLYHPQKTSVQFVFVSVTFFKYRKVEYNCVLLIKSNSVQSKKDLKQIFREKLSRASSTSYFKQYHHLKMSLLVSKTLGFVLIIFFSL